MKDEIMSKTEVAAKTTYYNVEIYINGKWANYSVWESFDDNLGETDFGYEKIDSDKLTKKELKEVEEYILNRSFQNEMSI